MKYFRIALTLSSAIILLLTLGSTWFVLSASHSAVEKTVKSTETVLLPEATSMLVCPKLIAKNQTVAVYLANPNGKADGAYTRISGENSGAIGDKDITLLDVDYGGVITAQPKSGRNTAIVGATWGENKDKNPGIALSQCKEPALVSQYLSSGSEVGKTHTLTLVNSYERPVKAVITVWSERGREKTQQFVNVPAKSEKNMVLDAFYPQHKRLLIRVEAEGKGVVSFLRETTEKGLKDLGATQVPVLGQAAYKQIIPAIKLEKESKIWIYNPGKKAIKYRVVLYNRKGITKLQDGKEFEVLGESIFSLPLEEHSGELYAIGVIANAPVQAAVYQPYKLAEKGSSYMIDAAVEPQRSGVLFATEDTKVQLAAVAEKNTKITLKSISDPTIENRIIDLKMDHLLLEQLPKGVWQWEANNPVTVTANYKVGSVNLALNLPSFPLIGGHSAIEVAVQP